MIFSKFVKTNIDCLSDCNETRIHNHLVRKRTLNRLAKLAYGWAVLWVLICTVHLAVCSYHVTYAFQSESTLYTCLNVKECHARNRRDTWSLSDCNETRTYNHSARKRTINRLAKLANCLAKTWHDKNIQSIDCLPASFSPSVFFNYLTNSIC